MMMMLMKTTGCLLLLSLASTLVESSRQVTLTCGTDNETTARGFPGAPGKRGIQGVKGERGMKGERGQRYESREAISRLQQKVGELEVQIVKEASQRNETERRLEQRLEELEVQLTRVGNRTVEDRQNEADSSNATNCNEIYNAGKRSDGVYSILVNGQQKQVYCQFQKAGFNWLVFQKRFSGQTEFYLGFSSYVQGFGDISGEFWLGLETLHQITTSRPHRLRVDLEDWEGNTAYAEYSSFSIGDSSTNYRLTVSGYSGNAGDSLNDQNNGAFSTYDRDNDVYGGNCAVDHHGAWWYNHCSLSSLNGEYLRGGQVNYRGLVWHDWKYSWYSMKITEMKVRPV